MAKEWFEHLGYDSVEDVAAKIAYEGLAYWLDGYHNKSSFEKLPDSDLKTRALAFYDAKDALEQSFVEAGVDMEYEEQ